MQEQAQQQGQQQVRQGDVWLLPVAASDTPPDCSRLDTDVMVEGELTGHAHRISDLRKAFLFMVGIQMYLKVLERTTIEHEDHVPPIPVDPGVYKIVRQVEPNPFGDVRTVED